MKKGSLLVIFITIVICNIHSQNYTINQQSQQVNINVPVIEKPVYIEKYRTIYVNKPRVAKKLDKPVLLLGYLWVYPEDLGNFKKIPYAIINSVNAQSPYGRDNWRIPTPEELSVLEANADKIGMGDDIYLATDHCNGVLRLVSTGMTLKEQTEKVLSSNQGKKIGNTIWSSSIYEEGPENYFSFKSHSFHFPQGWRLPTLEEISAICKLNNNDAIKTWHFFKDLTSYELKIKEKHCTPGRVFSNGTTWSGGCTDINRGYIIYCDNDGNLKTAIFGLGTEKTKPFIDYGEDVYSNYGYVILVFDPY